MKTDFVQKAITSEKGCQLSQKLNFRDLLLSIGKLVCKTRKRSASILQRSSTLGQEKATLRHCL